MQANILLRGLWPGAPQNLPITAVVTDSRDVVPGCVFVAIRGERVDGHDYAQKAVEQGAAIVVAQHPIEGVSPGRTVLVEDPLDALIAMGANCRNLYNPLVVGVTGSVGKTTTKEFCAAVFSAFGETLKTEGNQNNEIGMPKTIFRLTGSVRYAVLEMGMQGLGEIRKLTLAARPDAAIITKIGTSHMEHLGSVENIRRAKMEIVEGLAVGGLLLLNGDDPLLWGAEVPEGVRAVYVGIQNEACPVRAVDVRAEGNGLRFGIEDAQYGHQEAFIPAVGLHNVGDALLAYAAATRLGLNATQAAEALGGYIPADMRQIMGVEKGVIIIEDCYNANPDSMLAALETMRDLPVRGKRIAVLGDMRELGSFEQEAHRRMGEQCAQNGVGLLLTVGELAALAVPVAAALGVEAHACTGNVQAAALLAQRAQPGDAVLVKASRALQFEEILRLYRQA